MLIKITCEGTVSRIYSETRGQYTSTYVVVTDNSGKFPDVLRFKLKKDGQPNCAEGDAVKVTAYLHGREWVPNDGGEPKYFTDLNLDTVEVVSSGNSAPAADNGSAHDWDSLLALGAANGEDATAVRKRCEALKAKLNRRFTPEDYAAIGREIVAAHAVPAPAPSNDFENDLPF